MRFLDQRLHQNRRLVPRRLWSGALLSGLCLIATGCGPLSSRSASLKIATTWSEDERTALANEFKRWLADQPDGQGLAHDIEWLYVDPGESLIRVISAYNKGPVARGRSIDLALGGSVAAYSALERQGWLANAGMPGGIRWRIARREPIRFAVNGAIGDGRALLAGGDPSQIIAYAYPGRRFTFDDPRHAPWALAWAKSVLNESDWAAGYARLVRTAGASQRVCRLAGAALASVERGEAAVAPALLREDRSETNSVVFVSGPRGLDWVEGVAIVQGGGNITLSNLFLEFLGERGQAEAPSTVDVSSPAADALLADLLGATLVDAQNELSAACETLGFTRQWPVYEAVLTESPPWPPASVAKLLKGKDSGALLETLLQQVAPEADCRSWLFRSWLLPEHPVDDKLLAELADAVKGRLVREERFRAWLRAEWTAWARQRYRRVDRQARRTFLSVVPERVERTDGSSHP